MYYILVSGDQETKKCTDKSWSQVDFCASNFPSTESVELCYWHSCILHV